MPHLKHGTVNATMIHVVGVYNNFRMHKLYQFESDICIYMVSNAAHYIQRGWQGISCTAMIYKLWCGV